MIFGKVRGVFPAREDKDVAARGCVYVGMSAVYRLFKSYF
jgi:hypothetical protein